jgi:NitT/TauT family transport system substrate-binding protein
VNAVAPAVSAEKATAAFLTTIGLMKNEISDRDGMGAIDAALLRKTWMWVAESKEYDPGKVDPEAAVDRSFLR